MTPTAKTQTTQSNFTDAKFEEALDRKLLAKAPPEFVVGNRSQAERVYDEDELNANTRAWFADFEEQVRHYETLGHDLQWLIDWTKKWWWSWLVRDLDVVREICTEDMKYKDPVSFGKTMVGIQEFIDYNVAFFDAVPDWRYDPLPGQFYLNVAADGSARMMVRYVGTGHWDAPLRLYPFDETAQSLPGNGAFIQCPAVDRYDFDADGRLGDGETLWDAFDAMQMSGLFPKADSIQFKLVMNAAKLPNLAARVRRHLPR